MVVRIQKLADALTRREIEVLTLSARGKTAAQIAKDLGITKRTVVAHRESIVRKLKAANLTHAVALALTTQIIGAP
jgi:DNA-binding CsgD family transcriptional regulator